MAGGSANAHIIRSDGLKRKQLRMLFLKYCCRFKCSGFTRELHLGLDVNATHRSGIVGSVVSSVVRRREPNIINYTSIEYHGQDTP